MSTYVTTVAEIDQESAAAARRRYSRARDLLAVSDRLLNEIEVANLGPAWRRPGDPAPPGGPRVPLAAGLAARVGDLVAVVLGVDGPCAISAAALERVYEVQERLFELIDPTRTGHCVTCGTPIPAPREPGRPRWRYCSDACSEEEQTSDPQGGRR